MLLSDLCASVLSCFCTFSSSWHLCENCKFQICGKTAQAMFVPPQSACLLTRHDAFSHWFIILWILLWQIWTKPENQLPNQLQNQTEGARPYKEGDHMHWKNCTWFKSEFSGIWNVEGFGKSLLLNSINSAGFVREKSIWASFAKVGSFEVWSPRVPGM